MIKKFYAVLVIVFNLFYLLIPCYYLAKDKKKGILSMKNKVQIATDNVISNYLFNKINIEGVMKKSEPNKINLLIANHISIIDFMLIVNILYKNGINDYYFVFKDSILKIPMIGSGIKFDIHLSRNWETDQHLIKDQLKTIESGTILIYPEGTRYTNKKHKDSINFCIENKLPIYNYTLTPRAKGLHYFYKILQEEKRLDSIYDITLIVPKYIKKELGLKQILLDYNLGYLDVIISKLNFTKEDLDYEKFKKKLYYYWLIKNVQFENKLKILNV